MTKSDVESIKAQIVAQLEPTESASLDNESVVINEDDVDWKTICKNINVDEMAVSYSEIGEKDYQLQIRVYSTDLLDTARQIQNLVKERYNGETQIEHLYDVEFIAGVASDDSETCIRPLETGLRVGYKGLNRGALSGFVKLDSGAPGILSCRHVLAPPAKVVKPGEAIHQSGCNENRRKIAKLHKWVKWSKTDTNPSDAAVAAHLCVKTAGNVVPTRYEETPPHLQSQPIRPFPKDKTLPSGTPVFKVGYDSQYTEAIFNSVWDTPLPISGYSFTNVMQVDWDPAKKSFHRDGESGCLLLASVEGSVDALGILFAKGRIRSVADDSIKRVSFAVEIHTALESCSAEWLDSAEPENG